MRIGIDIDGVLADVLTTWVKEMNQYFNQNKRREDIFAYKFEDVYEVPWEEMDRFFRTNQQLLLCNLAPIEKAQATLLTLSKQHEIYLITARPEEYKVMTQSWLDCHQIPYHKIIFTNFQDKADYCKTNNIDLFIEDSIENALSISQIGIPVLLFDAPYNQRELPKLVFRKKNWKEIYQAIEAKTYNI